MVSQSFCITYVGAGDLCPKYSRFAYSHRSGTDGVL